MSRSSTPSLWIALLLVLLAAGSALAGHLSGREGIGPGGSPGSATAARPYRGTYAFVDVNVVPMDRRRVLEHQTVLVRDGVIRAVADTGAVQIPEDAVRIDGSGRYLLPGLGDMYARLPPEGTPDQEMEDLLFLFVANGVTTIRQATGRPRLRTLKVRLQRDQVLGPTLYVSSPPFDLDLSVPDSVVDDSVDAAVTRVARERWDLLRVSQDMSLRAWDLTAGEVVKHGLAFGGPVPDSVGLRHALATGVSTVDHLDGLLRAVVSDPYQHRMDEIFAPVDSAAAARADSTGEPLPPRPPMPPLDSLVRAVVPRKIWAVAGRARAAGVWMVPTLRADEVLHSSAGPDSLLTLPELRYLPREMRGEWIRRLQALPPTDTATARLLARTRSAEVQAVNDLNGGLLLGTDSPWMFNVPGFSAHREMRLMEEAGLTPYEVLIAATRNPAAYASGELRESGRFGTVAEGNRADLILVEGDPLEDLGALERRDGVMVRGRWLTADEIRSRLDAIAARYDGTVPEPRDGPSAPDSTSAPGADPAPPASP